jgi:hypothetical protein
MPFTLSHAAAALPFRRTRLVQSALVAGCFAPDFEYFLGHHGAFGHTLPGAFLLDLPLAFAALWLFHRFLKEPLAACLPKGIRKRLDLGPRSLSIDSAMRLMMIAFSILVGIATHIFWDSFTHQWSWLYHHWQFLGETVNLPWFGKRPWFGILQYLSSVFGLVVILLWCAHWYRSAPPIHRDPFAPNTVRLSRIVFACAFAAAMLAGFLRAVALGTPSGITGAQRFATHIVITAISVFTLETIIFGFVWTGITVQAEGRATQTR